MTDDMKKFFVLPVLAAVLASCGQGAWTPEERSIIVEQDSLMNVLTMPGDSAVLRAKSIDLTQAELRSEELRTLIAKLRYTVTDPSQDGVGISAPQVGLSRRVILVQRFDKDGEPFEAYVNIGIDSLYGETTHGREGCLSIPGKVGTVPRSSKVDIHYTDPESLQILRETVEGFTAIIFQHECDHLEGILYTDRADSVWSR